MNLESAERIRALTDKINGTTGENDGTLAEAVDRAIVGYGKGGFPNGTEWTKCKGIEGEIYCSAYANGIWVAGGENSIYYSEDGKTWSLGVEYYNPYDEYSYIDFEKIVYCDGMFIAYGYYDLIFVYGDYELGEYYAENYARIYYSTDGKSWTYAFEGGTYSRITDIVRANGMWVASLEGDYSYSHIAYSSDGKNWLTAQNGVSDMFPYSQRIEYANGIWVGTADDGVFYSTDGKAWTGSNVTGYGQRSAPRYGDGIWVFGDRYKGGVYYSTDGKTWVAGNADDSIALVTYANGLWTANGRDDIYYSDDGKVWNNSGLLTVVSNAGLLKQLKCINGVWFADRYLSLYYSVDGKTWEESDFPLTTIYDIKYASGIYLAGTAEGVYYSTDGKVWKTSDTEKSTRQLLHGGGTWVAVQNSGMLYSVTWEEED